MINQVRSHVPMQRIFTGNAVNNDIPKFNEISLQAKKHAENHQNCKA
jgi:hypothetical protein